MSGWDIYLSQFDTRGNSKREATLIREARMMNNKIGDNLSYNSIIIEGVTQQVAIIDTDNYNEKIILSMPFTDIQHGGLVYWMNEYWLVTERDANATIRTRAKMVQCNHLLKWVSDDGKIHEQWCIIEDGTKYLTGELEDRNFVVTRGDSRIAMTIAKNEFTSKFTREDRFLIDDPDSEIPLSYLLTKPLKLGGTYNNNGVFKFVLQEVASTDDDNKKLQIANYYKYFPKEASADRTNSSCPVCNPVPQNTAPNIVINTDNISEDTGKKVWL